MNLREMSTVPRLESQWVNVNYMCQIRVMRSTRRYHYVDRMNT